MGGGAQEALLPLWTMRIMILDTIVQHPMVS
jgi:hypothetical protein